jgi:hypothetical protein
MPLLDYKLVRVDPTPDSLKPRRGKAVAATFWAFVAIGASAAPAGAGVLSRSVDVPGSPDAVWAAIGSFCAIGEWHPAIASCGLDGRTPPTRTLATQDHARFVELQTARDEANRFYTYTFLSSPLPVKNYSSTFKVTGKAKDVSTITWSGSYAADRGDAKQAQDALAGIYESGLAAIKAKLAR